MLKANSSACLRSSLSGLPLFVPPKYLRKLYVLKPLQLNSPTIAGSTAMLDLTILSNENINDSNIEFINGMTNIIMLWIQGAPQFSDISAVSNFSKLTRLILTNCNISDISPAAGLTNLKELYLEGNPIKDYSPLKDIYPNLEKKF
jgi:Leucine-rich repeat (LRR) protein